MDPLVVAEVFVLAFALVFFSVKALGYDGHPADAALERLNGGVSSRERVLSGNGGEGSLLRLLHLFSVGEWLERNMWQAGLYMRASEILLMMVLLFGVGEAAGAALLEQPMVALACGFVLAAIPIFYVRMRRRLRLKHFSEQLPYALDLIKSLLEAGHSLLRGFQAVAKDFRDPIATEFNTVLEQASLGLPLPRALEEMLKRVPEDDLRLLVVAVRVQSEVGSSLAQIIGRLSEIVRNRQRLHAQVRAMTAQSRMSGIVVALLPALVLAAFSAVQPGYASTLFHDPIGFKLLKVAAGLDLMALFTMRRLLRVNY